MAPHTPGSGRVHRPELERRIAHEAAPAIGVAADQAEHPIEEPPDLGRGGPGLLERPDHRVHDGLRVALQGPEEEVALDPEGGVEPIAARSRATHQVIQPGVAVAMAPKLLQGAIEGFGRFEVLGSWHGLTSQFKNRQSDIRFLAGRAESSREPGGGGPSYRSEPYLHYPGSIRPAVPPP